MKKQFILIAVILVTLAADLYGLEKTGNPWTIGRNEIYISSSAFSLRSRHRFNPDSQKLLFSNDGTTKVYGFSVSISYGLTDRINVTAAVPVIGYDFSDSFNKLTGSGLGDIKSSLKIKLYDGVVTTALEFGFKFPSPHFSGNFTDVRIGDGQYDYESSVSVGFQPSKYFSFMNIDLGYRLRKENKESISKPGNEFFFRFDSGIMLRNDLLLSSGVEGFSGGRLETFGLKFPDTEKNLFSISMSLVKGITPKTGIMFNYNIPVAGKNYNAGSTFSIGFFFFKGNYINLNRKLNMPNVTCQALCQI